MPIPLADADSAMGPLPASSPPREYLAGRVLNDLNSLVDEWHDFFDEIEDAPWSVAFQRALAHVRLVTHEWLANLVQHADFGECTPCVAICAQSDSTCLHVIIEDNSAGFDFYGRLRTQAERLGALPDRGMGLLIIGACTDKLSYQRTAPYLNRLAFTVSIGEERAFNVPLSDVTSARTVDRHRAAAA